MNIYEFLSCVGCIPVTEYWMPFVTYGMCSSSVGCHMLCSFQVLNAIREVHFLCGVGCVLVI